MNLLAGERSWYFQEMACLRVIWRGEEKASVLMRLDRVLGSCAGRCLVRMVLGGILIVAWL
jgi:hypothetical protein